MHEIAKEVPITIYCGVDFHARQQTICYGDPDGREVCLRELRHDRDDVRGFYAQFTGDVVVGLEASGYSTWFVELLEGLGHQVFIGDAAEVHRRARRRQKNDLFWVSPTPPQQKYKGCVKFLGRPDEFLCEASYQGELGMTACLRDLLDGKAKG